MATSPRLERFKRDVVEMKLKTGNERRERLLQRVGAVMMIVGIVVGLVTYQASLNQSDVRDVESSIILVVVMLAVAVTGAALFLAFTMTRFLRLWLLRQLYEGQAHVDDVLERLTGRDGNGDGAGRGRDRLGAAVDVDLRRDRHAPDRHPDADRLTTGEP